MDAALVILTLLGYLCTLTCALPFLGVFNLFARWQALRTVEGFQAQLLGWAAAEGCTIVRQERPERPRRLLSPGSFPWLNVPRDSPWAFDWYGRTGVPSYSTRVVLRGRDGTIRQGRMRYVGSALGGFWWSVESRWEEEVVTPEPPARPDPREDPLWDRWVDSPGAE
jgi:hypothetical protein